MEADIPAANVRVFARAINTLAKIGDVLIVETAPDGLLVRALSQAQSSYAQISFAPSFFTHYAITPIAGAVEAPHVDLVDGDQTADLSYRTRPPSAFSTTGSYPSPSPSPPPATTAVQRPHKVIVNSKACQAPFRGAVSMIKRLTLRLTTEDDCGYGEFSAQHSEDTQWQQPHQQNGSQRGRRKRGRDIESGRRGAAVMELEKDLCLMLQLHLDDLGVTKTYRIPTTEQTNILQPDFSRQSCPTVLSAKAAKFQTWLTNFQSESAALLSQPRAHDMALRVLAAVPLCCPTHVLASSCAVCMCSVDELSVSCGPDSVRLRSYQDWQSAGLQDPHAAAGLPAIGEFDNSSNGNKADRAKRQRLKSRVVTESAIANSELNTRTVHETCLNSPLIFTLHELKQFVGLCELTDEELFIFAQSPGQPILITNTRQPFQSTEQQRAAAIERQRQHQQQHDSSEQEGVLTAEDGRDGVVVSSLVPPSPTSVGGSEYSFNTAAAMEQSHRTWSGELILSTLASDVTMPHASFSPSPSPSPAPTHDSSQPTPQPTQTSSQPLPARQQQLRDHNGS